MAPNNTEHIGFISHLHPKINAILIESCWNDRDGETLLVTLSHRQTVVQILIIYLDAEHTTQGVQTVTYVNITFTDPEFRQFRHM